MGQKVHPYGYRLGIIRQPKARWFSLGRTYRQWLVEDLRIRNLVRRLYSNAGISDIIIDRTMDTLSVTIFTAKPGVVIGRGGRDVDLLRQRLEQMTGKRSRVNVEEASEPDLNAQLIAENIARQIERRVSHRWAMRQAMERALRQGAKGIKIKVSGRLGGVEIARSESMGPVGRLPLSTLRADIDYGLDVAHTTYGPIGVKVWVYRGEVLPPRRLRPPEEELEELEAEIAEAQRQLHGEERVPEAPAVEAGPVAPAEAQPVAPPPRPATVAPPPAPVVFQTVGPEQAPIVDELMEQAEPVSAEVSGEEPASAEEPASGSLPGPATPTGEQEGETASDADA
jgi:small subunit ribosomal protein S3